MTDLGLLQKLLSKMHMDTNVYPEWIPFDKSLAASLDREMKQEYAETLADCWSMIFDRATSEVGREEISRRIRDVIKACKICDSTYPLSLLERRLAHGVAIKDVESTCEEVRSNIPLSSPEVAQALQNFIVELKSRE